jgi:hypothetical protein
MRDVGVLHGTCLQVDLRTVIATMPEQPSEALISRAVSDVVETCWAAKQESQVTFAQLVAGDLGARAIAPFIEAIKRAVGLLVGVQFPTASVPARVESLVGAGVDRVSLAINTLVRRGASAGERLAAAWPDVASLANLAALLPAGGVSAELLLGVGLAPLDDAAAVAEQLAGEGVLPAGRVLFGAGAADGPTHPAFTDLRRVMERVYAACRRQWLPIDVPANVEMSSLVTADDAALLAERTPAFYWYEGYRRITRLIARPKPRRLKSQGASHKSSRKSQVA